MSHIAKKVEGKLLKKEWEGLTCKNPEVSILSFCALPVMATNTKLISGQKYIYVKTFKKPRWFHAIMGNGKSNMNDYS